MAEQIQHLCRAALVMVHFLPIALSPGRSWQITKRHGDQSQGQQVSTGERSLAASEVVKIHKEQASE